MKNRKPKIVVAPEGCEASYLTPRKEYKVLNVDSSRYTSEEGFGFNIINDTGDKLYCLEKKCAHLNDKDWIIKEYEDE